MGQRLHKMSGNTEILESLEVETLKLSTYTCVWQIFSFRTEKAPWRH